MIGSSQNFLRTRRKRQSSQIMSPPSTAVDRREPAKLNDRRKQYDPQRDYQGKIADHVRCPLLRFFFCAAFFSASFCAARRSAVRSIQSACFSASSFQSRSRTFL